MTILVLDDFSCRHPNPHVPSRLEVNLVVKMRRCVWHGGSSRGSKLRLFHRHRETSLLVVNPNPPEGEFGFSVSEVSSLSSPFRQFDFQLAFPFTYINIPTFLHINLNSLSYPLFAFPLTATYLSLSLSFVVLLAN